MQTITVLFILLALILSVTIAYYQYFHASKDAQHRKIILSVLRTISTFLLLLLLINPTIKKVIIENNKPILAILADNSASIKFFEEEQRMKSVIKKIKENASLNSKFDLEYYSFDKQANVSDSLTFTAPITAISNSINSVNQLYKNKKGAILLLSDGNQTAGNDYEYLDSKLPISTVVLGDTVPYKDVRIRQLNVNKYSFVNNKFPVEVMLYYEGDIPVTTEYAIYKKGKKIFKQKISFSPTERSKIIRTNLTASGKGNNIYKATVNNLINEKNTNNNSKDFSVQVIDEQTEIALIASALHPDIGALKRAIESNKQRTVALIMIDKLKEQLENYQLIIAYQPDDKFAKIFSEIKIKKLNYLLISGSNTDWNFLNEQGLGFQKNVIDQTQNYIAHFNESFLPFSQKDIGFNSFPPLIDKFGEVKITKENQKLLLQQVFGIRSQQPLIATTETQEQKAGIVFGEGIWRWRATSFLMNNTFQDFDKFIGSFVQYLASTKKRNRLEIAIERVYASNSPLKISAFYTDKNFKFDNRASLLLSISNTETKKQKNIPFALLKNSYEVTIEDLPPGSYTYTVSVDGGNKESSGNFLISKSEIEAQFNNANSKKLKRLSNRTGGKLYYPTEIDRLVDSLNDNKKYSTTQKAITKEQFLIDWEWILFLILTCLSVEWFTRKYYGKN